jgi:hypothetical protein
MPLRDQPRRPLGTIPNKSFVDGGDADGIKVGILTRVDELNMKADIRILTGGGNRIEVDLTQSMTGPRSFWGGVPEVNSLVLVGYRRRHKGLLEACILGYLPVGTRAGMNFDPFAPVDPSEVPPEDKADVEDVVGKTYRRKRLMLTPGDVGGMSAAGAELVLAKDVRMVNRAGDLFELRDSERSIVAQSVHRVEAESGVHRLSGPVRRGVIFLPPDIFREDGKTLKDTTERYFGRDDLQDAGPGASTGGPTKFSNTLGVTLDLINDTKTFPPVTLANGRRYFYPATNPAVNIEDGDLALGAEAYTEHRLEMFHTTDLSQEVLAEIDGFQVDRKINYIEQVFGTVIGNDAFSGAGQRNYAQVLKPKIFDEFWQTGPGSFSLEEAVRTPLEDIEVRTLAGAYLLKMQPPLGNTTSCYAVCVNKQGKLFANVPGSTVENYAASSNVSAEINLEGALKMFIGAQKPDNCSAHIYCEGGVVWEVGHLRGAPGGTGFEIRSHSGLSISCIGPADDNQDAMVESVQGNISKLCTGSSVEQVQGSKATTVNGAYQLLADRIQQSALQGFSGNYADLSQLVSGKTMYNYAMQVMETVVTGGKMSTVLAGGVTETIAAGAKATTVAAGAITVNCPSGAYTLTVGTGSYSATVATGAVTLSTGAGAMTISAGGGAVAITAGLAMNLTASTVVSILAPQILLGGPAAVLGVVRGAPMLPPGAFSPDLITGSTLWGSALIRSI